MTHSNRRALKRLRRVLTGGRPARGPRQLALRQHMPRGWSQDVDPVIGLAAGDEPVRLTPADGHTLALVPPGMGATTLLRTLGAQLARHGVHVDLFDTVGEHRWATGLPHLTRYDDPEEMHHQLYHLAHAAQSSQADRRDRRHAVLIEERALAEMDAFHHTPWPGARGMDALITLLAHGRPHGFQVVLACPHVPPSLTPQASLLVTTQLLGEPPSHRDLRPGRMRLVSPRRVTAVQVLHLSEPEATHLALTGAPGADG
ncbi:hypothetical protein [Streptomyces nanshensis]|uniref:FtsK domain-containing protein n=1 Tax=Streptomyces nanshensis TaxID=518642 RepID=A0A1E7LBY6_9ACTN|nr:hypothetical protein [Streptomyces nanshensis]OEV13739.1 hypothetical protein AN218_02065 [Streptomyces nanshensis]